MLTHVLGVAYVASAPLGFVDVVWILLGFVDVFWIQLDWVSLTCSGFWWERMFLLRMSRPARRDMSDLEAARPLPTSLSRPGGRCI